MSHTTFLIPLSDDPLILHSTPHWPNTMWRLLTRTTPSFLILLYGTTILRDNAAATSHPQPRSSLSSTRCSPAAYACLAAVLRAVREALATSSSSAAPIDPALVTTVAGLAAAASSIGNWSAATAHWRAATALLTRRPGGWDGLERFERRALAWCEFPLCAGAGTAPGLGGGEEAEVEAGVRGLATGFLEAVQGRVEGMAERLGGRVRGTEAGEVVGRVWVVVVAGEGEWWGRVERGVVAAVLDQAERRLLVELVRVKEEEEGVGVYASVAQAVQIFLWGALGPMPIRFVMSGLFSVRLREALGEGNMVGMWEEEATVEALLWVLVMGYITADERTADWYEEKLMVVMRRLDIRSEEQLVSMLQDFLWTDKLCREACRRLWASVETYQSLAGVLRGCFLF
ncbi:uncharacterized protein K452DRAFT_93176 [Neofusicoccum parvum]|nr:uncharacterized protein K452DRAFT_93176 [Neofusicoccum parvum]